MADGEEREESRLGISQHSLLVFLSCSCKCIALAGKERLLGQWHGIIRSFTCLLPGPFTGWKGPIEQL